MSIGIRLREERERLGFSQAGFAEIAGAHRKSQGNYELGDRMPDAAYLSAIAAAGADVLYILTGQRAAAPAVAAEPALTSAQRKLLRDHAAASEDGQKMIEGAAAFAAQQAVPERLKKRA